MKKNDIIQLKCIEETFDGYGRCFFNDKLVFVKYMLKDEECLVKIIKITNKCAFAIISSFINTSSYRNTNICSVYNKCGGCNLLHMSYDKQLELKQKRIKDVFKQIAKIDINVKDIVESKKQYNYRNKVAIPINNNLIGYYRKNTNDIVEFKECYVQPQIINDIYNYLKTIIYDYPNLTNIIIKYAHNTTELMIVLITNKESDNYNKLITNLTNKFIINSIILNVNESKSNVILGNQEILLYGKSYIEEKLLNLKFNISSKSFFQINPYQTINLYQGIIDIANLNKNDIVIDLYCGIGTITLFLALHTKYVYGIEIVPQAIIDANNNAKLNNIDNVEFICSDASIFLEFVSKNIDVVVVDPPRKGLTVECINSILDLKPNKLVYISCNPATLARDYTYLQQYYNIEEVRPYDMFPNTDHVECITLMTLC